jgi:hypothetical protein
LLALAATPAPGRRLPAGQRLLLARVLKQATQATTHPQKQHTASVAAKPGVKAYLTVLLVGLVGVAIGLIASSSFLIVVGSIVTIVGILLLILRSIYA